MRFRQHCSCISLRVVIIITLCFIVARCYIELTVVHSEKLKHSQRHRFSEGKENANPKHEVKSNFDLKGKDEISKYSLCITGLMSSVYHSLNKITTEWSLWTYKKLSVCPTVFINSTKYTKSQPSTYIHCKTTKSNDKTHISINKANGIQTMPFGSVCLDEYIQACCTMDQMPVPNIVHYVWYGTTKPFSFFYFLSFISVIRFVRPCVILIHGDTEPKGLYWNFILTLYPKIIHIQRKLEARIYGKRPKHRNHYSDIFRIQALLRYGGIYLDMDMVLVKRINFLRQYPCTISRMRSHLLASSFIMATKNSTFLQKWLDGYKYHYRNDSYIYSAMNYPSQLSYNFTHLIHVEFETLSRPWSQHGDRIYKNNFDWSKLYGMHLYNRLCPLPANETTIRQMNNTFGAISRHILFGNKELCVN